MSLPIKIPVEARPFLTANSFTATFNTPTINRYDWNLAANINQDITINPGRDGISNRAVYIIERVNFSMNIPEGDFQSSIITVPTIQLSKKVAKQAIYPTAQPFVNYVDNLELLTFFWTQNANDQLRATFNGVLQQVANTVGLTTITALVQFNIYEINSQQWKKNFLERKSELGIDLNMRGGFGTIPRNNLSGLY